MFTAHLAARPVARRLAISAGVAAVVVATGHVIDAILLGWAAVVTAPVTGFDPISTYTTWLFAEPTPGSDRP